MFDFDGANIGLVFNNNICCYRCSALLWLFEKVKPPFSHKNNQVVFGMNNLAHDCSE